nr:peroxisomal membrane protein PEX13-like isoform X3 [Dermacentor andersoni]
MQMEHRHMALYLRLNGRTTVGYIVQRVEEISGDPLQQKNAQVLLVYVVFQAYALDHHQPNQAGYTGPPHPYNFGYDNVDEYGNRQFRNEQGDFNNAKTGSYGYRDANGLYRRVNYVADANGFRATVDTNEPGTAPGASADAVFNAAPVVPPVPSGAAQIGAPTAFAARAASAYNAGGYSGYGRYGYNPYAGAAAAHGNDAYGCQGYAASGPALGGYAYGGSVPYGYRDAGYAASYALGGYGAPVGYGSWPSAHHGHRRR